MFEREMDNMCNGCRRSADRLHVYVFAEPFARLAPRSRAQVCSCVCARAHLDISGDIAPVLAPREGRCCASFPLAAKGRTSVSAVRLGKCRVKDLLRGEA